MSLISELRRRNVLRVVTAYAAAAWVLVEVTDLLTDIYGAPPWVMKSLVATVLLGVVPVIILSWVYEITPEGVRKESEEPREYAPASRRQLNIVVAVMFAVAIGFFVAGRLSTRVFLIEGDGPPPIVAVLPFVSTSLDGDSEFFAAGVHDDLLTKMAQLQAIRVISRTSVMEYRDTDMNIREIGAKLGAHAILEGGVQSAGNRIRINAQLIDVATDEHLWAQTYDRDLSMTDIFEIQSDIARAITAAMETTLTDHDAEVITTIPTENMAAYRAFRRAQEIRATQGSWLNEDYLGALEEAVALDPNFTRAWVEMVQYLTHANYFSEPDPELTTRAKEILERISKLAPGSADYLLAQSYYAYYVVKDYDQANELIGQAHALQPGDTTILEVKSCIQRRQGDFDGALETTRKLSRLTPGNTGMVTRIVDLLMFLHRYDEAVVELARTYSESYWLDYFRLLMQLREHGDLARWAADIKALSDDYGDDAEFEHLFNAYLAARDFAAAEAVIAALPEPDMSEPVAKSAFFDKKVGEMVVYWFQGDQERAARVAMEAQQYIDFSRSNDGIGELAYAGTAAAISAVLGDAEDTIRFNQKFLRDAEQDHSARMHYQQVCQTLGIVGAVYEAVDCIRVGLTEPSYLMPFLEPYLPYYDSIREHPAFLTLLADLEWLAEAI